MKTNDTNQDIYKIIGCAMEVYNILKSGYLESVYEKALEFELLEAGLSVKRQVRIPVYYKGVDINCNFIADMVVNDSIIVELKKVNSILAVHEAQLRSYLLATGVSKGVILNFGNPERLEWRNDFL